MSISLKVIESHIRKLANPTIAEHSRRFFKTGPGEYAEGDECLGIRVPVVRQVAKQFAEVELKIVFKLLQSAYHEERLLALIMMVNRCQTAPDSEEHRTIYDHYLANTQQINNWDLVDCSAHKIVGRYLENRSRKPLYRLARSKLLWDRRIAIIATAWFIHLGETEDVLNISEILLHDSHDLIHKAVGWMLREMGKRHPKMETAFLDKHYQTMPRTMLRYAIEKYPEKDRQAYLKGMR